MASGRKTTRRGPLTMVFALFLYITMKFFPREANRLAYVFKPGSADLATLVGVAVSLYGHLFAVPYITSVALACVLLHVVITWVAHMHNIARLKAQDDMIASTSSIQQLFERKKEKLQEKVDEVSGLRAQIINMEQEVSQEGALQAKYAELERRVAHVQVIKSKISTAEKRLAEVPTVYKRFNNLKQKSRSMERIKWLCSILSAEVKKFSGYREQCLHLREERERLRPAHAELKALQEEAEQMVQLEARRSELQMKANAAKMVEADIMRLKKETADVPALESLKRELEKMKDARYIVKDDIQKMQMDGQGQWPNLSDVQRSADNLKTLSESASKPAHFKGVAKHSMPSKLSPFSTMAPQETPISHAAFFTPDPSFTPATSLDGNRTGDPVLAAQAAENAAALRRSLPTPKDLGFVSPVFGLRTHQDVPDE